MAFGRGSLTRILTAVLALILAAAAHPATAQTGEHVATWNPVFRTVHYDFRLMNPTNEAVNHIDVYVPLPHASKRQELHYLHYPKSNLKRTFTDVHGQRLLHYHLDRLEAGAWIDLGFVVGVTLSNLRWIMPETPETARKDSGPTLSPEARKRYLAAVPSYSMDSPLMQKTAAELGRGARDDFEKLCRIHDHVISGERCPFYYRARPERLEYLTRVGIDMVSAANNHGGDYGPAKKSATR